MTLYGTEAAEFHAKMGCAGWIAHTTHMQAKFAVYRAAQGMAKPTQGHLKHINQVLRYFSAQRKLAIGVPLFDPNPPTGQDAYAIYCDADNSSNPEINNKRRAQWSYVFAVVSSQEAVDAIGNIVPTHAPIMMASKSTGVAFATSRIGEAHVGCGSGENEIYGLANTINDVLYFSYIMEEMGRDSPLPMHVKTDATTAKAFANGTAKTRLHHIDQRQAWVAICRDKRITTVSHTPGTLNLADIGTKIFKRRPGIFHRLVQQLFALLPALPSG